MIIAKDKRRNNIAEYVLYMWQIEDLLRGFNFSMERVRKEIIDQYDQPEEVKKQIYAWYEGLIELMKAEGVTDTGHVSLIKNTVNDLNAFHKLLMQSDYLPEYQKVWSDAAPMILSLKNKTGNPQVETIEACFIGLYGLLMMRLRGIKVSDQTEQSMQKISQLLALLSSYFKKYESGELDLSVF